KTDGPAGASFLAHPSRPEKPHLAASAKKSGAGPAPNRPPKALTYPPRAPLSPKNMLQIEPIPCRRDNYAYLVHPSGAEQAVVVDPTDAEPVLEALARSGKKLSAILNTHHHGDH